MAFNSDLQELVLKDGSGLLATAPHWERVALGDVCEILNGAPFDSALFASDGEHPLVRIRDVLAGKTSTYYNGPNDPLFEVNNGDLLIGMDGDFNCAFWRGGRALLNQRVCRVSPDERWLSKMFVAHALPGYLKAINNHTPSVTVKHLSSKTVAAIPFPMPPKLEQERIVAKLDELLSGLDAGVAELKAAQRKLQRYRQSLLKAAVNGALTADWRRQHPPTETGADLLARILRERRSRWEAQQLARYTAQNKPPPKGWKDKYPEPTAPNTTDLPPLPEGWVWASVDQLSVVVRGASPRPAGDPRFFGGDIPWITVGSLTADDGMFLDRVDQFVTQLGKEASRFIDPQTLLLTNSGATLGVPKITRIGGCINDGSVALLGVEDPMKEFLYWFLRTQTVRLRALNQGAAQPNLNTDIVKRICVPICPGGEMESINVILRNLYDGLAVQVEDIQKLLKQSAAQRQNLLRAAFRGELVPQDPTDEPASAMLARLRAERTEMKSSRAPRKSSGRHGAGP